MFLHQLARSADGLGFQSAVGNLDSCIQGGPVFEEGWELVCHVFNALAATFQPAAPRPRELQY
jgi:hypothetical protein